MTLEYDEIRDFLTQHNWSVGAAEFHGLLSGLICAGVGDDDIDNWLPVLLQGGYLNNQEYAPIEQEVRSVFFEVQNMLNNDGFEYKILLPDDSQTIESRALSLHSWCRGFLSTLIEYGDIEIDQLSTDCCEFVADIQTISDAEIQVDDSSDDAESDLIAIEEYLRVGVQLIYEHLNPLESDQSDPSAIHVT